MKRGTKGLALILALALLASTALAGYGFTDVEVVSTTAAVYQLEVDDNYIMPIEQGGDFQGLGNGGAGPKCCDLAWWGIPCMCPWWH